MIQTAGFLCLFLSAGETAGQQVRPVNVSNGFNNPHKNSSLSLLLQQKLSLLRARACTVTKVTTTARARDIHRAGKTEV